MRWNTPDGTSLDSFSFSSEEVAGFSLDCILTPLCIKQTLKLERKVTTSFSTFGIKKDVSLLSSPPPETTARYTSITKIWGSLMWKHVSVVTLCLRSARTGVLSDQWTGTWGQPLSIEIQRQRCLQESCTWTLPTFWILKPFIWDVTVTVPYFSVYELVVWVQNWEGGLSLPPLVLKCKPTSPSCPSVIVMFQQIVWLSLHWGGWEWFRRSERLHS